MNIIGNFIFNNLISRFGNSGFSPLQLNPSLWLDSSDPNAIILDDSEVVSLLDKSESLTETNVYTSDFTAVNTYTSDFSSGIDGWLTTSNVDYQFGLSVGGRDDVLKGYADAVNSSHYARKDILTVNETFSGVISVYVPSGNTNINGYVINLGTTIIATDTSPILDTWIDIVIPPSITTVNNRLLVQYLKNGTGTFVGANDPNDDIIYIKDVVIDNLSDSVDGWLTSGFNTVDGGIDGIIDDFFTTKNNCLRGTCIGGSGASVRNLYKNPPPSLVVGKSYNYKAWVLVPSGQPTVDGFTIWTGEFLLSNDYNNTNGIWTYVDFNFVAKATTVRLYAKDGVSASPDANNDVFYIVDASIEEIQGNHFPQITPANRPDIQSSDFPVQTNFDSTASHFVENTLDVATFSAMSQGSVIYDIQTINDQYHFNISDATDTNSYFVAGIFSSKARLWILENGAGVIIQSVDNISVGDKVEWSSNGSLISLKVNGILAATSLASGSNTGQWISHVADLDNMSIARITTSSPIYQNTIFKQLLIYPTPLTDQQSLDVANYLDNIKAINPRTLNPELLLDARDTNALISDGTDNVAILDQSEELAEILVYQSDFSSGVDGWSNFRLTLSGNNDGVQGKNDVLKGVLNGGANTHLIRKTILTIGKNYNLTCSVLIPSSNVLGDGFLIRLGAYIPYTKVTAGSSWVDVDINLLAVSASLDIYITSGGGTSFSQDGDIIYFKDIVINEIQGNHFTQVTAANRGLQDSETVPTKITYDGVSDYSENTLDVATFAAMSQGSFIYIYDGLGATYNFSISETGTSGTTSRFWNGIAGGKYSLIIGSNTLTSTSVPSTDDIVEWKSSGSSYQLFINGIEDSIVMTAGTNNGSWLSSLVGLDNMRISSIAWNNSLFYYNTIFKHLFIRSTPLTDEESYGVYKFLDNKRKEAETLKLISDTLDKFPNALTTEEETKITAIVRYAHELGVWEQIDYLFFWFLTDEVNALTSLVGTKTATNVNSCTFNEFGVLPNGVDSYIDTGIVPSTDMTNYLLNNAHVEAYCYENLSSVQGDTLFGVRDVSANISRILQTPSLTRIDYVINALSGGAGTTTSGLFLNKTRYGVNRDGATSTSLYINRVQVNTSPIASSALSNENIYVGAYSFTGTPLSFLNARQSYFQIGGGFNLTALDMVNDLIETSFNLGVKSPVDEMLYKYETYGTALTGIERSMMIAYVEAEVASGNHALKDYETIYSLAGDNALVDYIGGKIATNVNAATHDINGFTFNGSTQYINSNFIPSTDGVKYTQNDANYNYYLKSVSNPTSAVPFGGIATAETRMFPNSGNLLSRINSGSSTNLIATEIISGNLYGFTRSASNRNDIFINGVSVSDSTAASTGVTSENFYVGAYNANGTAAGFLNGVIPSVMIGSAVGRNQVDYNANLRALLTGLGVTL